MTCFGLLQSLQGWAHARENFNGLELTVGILRTSPSLSLLSPLALLGFCLPLHWGTQPAQARVFSVATERRPLVQKRAPGVEEGKTSRPPRATPVPRAWRACWEVASRHWRSRTPTRTHAQIPALRSKSGFLQTQKNFVAALVFPTFVSELCSPPPFRSGPARDSGSPPQHPVPELQNRNRLTLQRTRVAV